MTKLGTLCAGGFERGSGDYWEVRRYRASQGSAYAVYRTRDEVCQMGLFNTAQRAYELFWQHVPNEIDIEASLSR